MKSRDEFLEYLVEFHCQRDYFECHEILEEFWKSDPKQERNDMWVGFIQIAVSLYHHRRENWEGARRMMTSAQKKLQKDPTFLEGLGIEATKLYKLLDEVVNDIIQQKPYKSIILPMTDRLQKKAEAYCAKKGIKWEINSSISNEHIIHKHKLRDRQDVIQERTNQLIAKRTARSQLD